jgi:cysteine-rich repeat protein
VLVVVSRNASNVALAVVLLASGCGLILDLDTRPSDGPSNDGGLSDSEMTDARPRTLCGDGRVDRDVGEECDDASSACVDCRWACDCPAIVNACLDRIDCVEGACEPVLRTAGSPCDAFSGLGTCAGSLCIPNGCGDGAPDPGEECDDGNSDVGDGCEPDCRFTCHFDDECQNGDLCDGLELCAPAPTGGGRVCAPGTPPSIVDCDACLSDVGVYTPDEDGDGYFADVGQPCEAERFDCDDLDPAVFPSASEVCNSVDDDCDGAIDEDVVTLTCGTDADGDGYPAADVGMTSTCKSGCPSGTVPIRRDSAGDPLLDCWDRPDAFGPSVHPGQTAYFQDAYCLLGEPGCVLPYDYDCDGSEEQQDVRVGPNCDLLSLAGCRGDGWVPPVPACGDSGVYADCRPVLLLVCGSERATRRQACR